MLLVGTWLHEKQELSKWLNSVRQSFSFIRLSVLRWSEKRPRIVMYKWKWNWRIRTAAHVLDGKNGNIKFWGIGIEASALPNQSQLNVITSPSDLLIEQHLHKDWKKCLSCLLFRYWSKKPAYYLVLQFSAEVIQTYSFWISQTFLKVCNKSLIFGFRLGQAFRFLLFICKLLACFLQFVFQGFFLFGELQQRKKNFVTRHVATSKTVWSYQLTVQLSVQEWP